MDYPEQAHNQAASYPSHARLHAQHHTRALSLRHAPGGWRDLGPIPSPGAVDPASAAVMIDLLERARAYQA